MGPATPQELPHIAGSNPSHQINSDLFPSKAGTSKKLLPHKKRNIKDAREEIHKPLFSYRKRSENTKVSIGL